MRTIRKLDANIILIDDNKDFIYEMEISIGIKNKLKSFTDPFKVLPILKNENNNIILLDIDLGLEKTGIDFIPLFLGQDPKAKIIMLSSEERTSIVASSIRKGAVDYLSKASTYEEIESTILKTYQSFSIDSQDQNYPNQRIIYRSKTIEKILAELKEISATDAAILFTGESGVGKDLFAKEVHLLSQRKNKAFYKIHCPSLNDDLFESELFGFEKGAFTGAVNSKEGKVEAANGGTLLLDEITETSLNIQGKLLRLVDDKEYEKVGSTKTLKSDIRVIANTNKTLKEYINNNKFRHDLFYRLSTFVVEIPPLRERIEDIIPLFNFYEIMYCKKYLISEKSLEQEAKMLLKSYSWLGNVRELKHTVERIVIKYKNSKTITKSMVLSSIGIKEQSTTKSYHEACNLTLSQFKYKYFDTLLLKTNGVIANAATYAKIPRQSLTRMVKECGIAIDKYRADT